MLYIQSNILLLKDILKICKRKAEKNTKGLDKVIFDTYEKWVFFTNFFICFYVIKSSLDNLPLFKDREKIITFIDIKGSESLAVGQTTNHFNKKQEKLSNI